MLLWRARQDRAVIFTSSRSNLVVSDDNIVNCYSIRETDRHCYREQPYPSSQRGLNTVSNPNYWIIFLQTYTQVVDILFLRYFFLLIHNLYLLVQ